MFYTTNNNNQTFTRIKTFIQYSNGTHIPSPSCLQTTVASSWSQPLSQTVDQTPFVTTSTLPIEVILSAFTNLMSKKKRPMIGNSLDLYKRNDHGLS